MIDNDEILVSQTDGIVVSAGPVLVDENESLKNHFMWGYYLCIENNSNHKIQLVGKDWNITEIWATVILIRQPVLRASCRSLSRASILSLLPKRR